MAKIHIRHSVMHGVNSGGGGGGGESQILLMYESL